MLGFLAIKETTAGTQSRAQQTRVTTSDPDKHEAARSCTEQHHYDPKKLLKDPWLYQGSCTQPESSESSLLQFSMPHYGVLFSQMGTDQKLDYITVRICSNCLILHSSQLISLSESCRLQIKETSTGVFL